MSSVLATVVDGTAWKSYYAIGTPGAVSSMVSAWCGAAFDYATSTMHIVASGGHGDSWNNQCYALQVPSGSWVRTAEQTQFPPDRHLPGSYEPVEWTHRNDANPPLTAGTGYNAEMGPNYPTAPTLKGAIVYFDGKPCSRHTYGGTIWLPVQRRVMLMGGACFPVGSPDSYCGWFDPASGNWERKANLPTASGRISTYDSARNHVIWRSINDNSVWNYDPATDTHVKIGPAASDPAGGIGGPYAQICCDSAGEYVYATVWNGWTNNAKLAPATYGSAILRMKLGQSTLQSWQPVKVFGDTTGMYGNCPGFEYDPDKNAFVFWAFEDPGNLSVLRLSDLRINRVPIKGVPPSTVDTQKGVWGRFRRYAAHSYCLMVSASAPVYLITLA